MKKFHFTLSRMLDYQNQILEGEKNALAIVQHKRNVIEERIDHLSRNFQDISAQMAHEQQKGIAAFRLIAFDAQRNNIREQLKQLRFDLKRAEAAVQKQMDVVVEASKEVTKLEKLHDRQLEDYRKAAAKAEEELIEEFVSSKRVRESLSECI
ncbi:MAG: flagellar export protein FliJ [Anaerotruncus sp.]|nr:flagellar export protein FliJ [Anaerotruncus sp.]